MKNRTPTWREGILWAASFPMRAGIFRGASRAAVIHGLSLSDPPDVVALFGMHLHPGSPFYLMTEGAWETPFGELPVASDLAGALAERFRFTIEGKARFTPDNTIELQLPFVKYFFKNVRVITIGAPPAGKTPAVARTLVSLAREMGLSLKVIGSTDLTHYGMNYGFTPKGGGPAALCMGDRRKRPAVYRGRPGHGPRGGHSGRERRITMPAAREPRHPRLPRPKPSGRSRAEAIAYATSHDKHPGESFVGYVGIVFE